MKKKLLFMLLIFIAATNLSAQKIEINEVDDFTGVRIIGTDFFRPQKEKMLKPLVVIKFGSSNNLPYLEWLSHYVNLYIVENSTLTLLDEEKNTYSFKCIHTNRKGNFRYIGDFDKIIGKNIVKYRMETINGYADFDIDKKRYTAISDYYLFLKSEIGKYFKGTINMDKLLNAAKDRNLTDKEKMDSFLKEILDNSAIESKKE